MGSCKEDKYSFIQQRGRFFRQGNRLRVKVRAEKDGLHGIVDGEKICTWKRASFHKGWGTGVFTTGPSLLISEILAGPPYLSKKVLDIKRDALRIHALGKAANCRFVLEADNGFAQSRAAYRVAQQ